MADLEAEGLQSPMDRIAPVDLARKVRLLPGRDFWATENLPEAGVRGVRTADGPNGSRHQSGRHDHLAMFESDPATCFPPAVAVGSSGDPELASRLGTALGREAATQGVGVSVKHSAMNSQETDRQTISTEVDDRTLREIHLPAFERVVREAQPATVILCCPWIPAWA